MKISLVGYMGSGKSSIGAYMASQLHIPFWDLDELIEQKANLSISELIDNLGEIRFRKLEREVLLEFLSNHKQFILSTGGGTPVYYDNMDQLNEYSDTIYLRLNPQELASRLMKEKSKRPLIAHIEDENLTEFIAKHLFERRGFYEKAKHTINVTEKLIPQISKEITNHLNLQK